MASSLAKPLFSLSSTVLKACVSRTVVSGPKLTAVSGIAKRGLWQVCAPRRATLLNTTKAMTASKMCGCSALHTEGDKELVTFLEKEISVEQQSSQTVPKPDGWKVSTKGSEVVLTKNVDGEEVSVKFNVNHSVDAESYDDSKEGETMVCKPDFRVDIRKQSGKVLSVACSHSSGRFEDMEGDAPKEDELEDQFEIDEVTIHDGEWTDSSYVMEGSTMDGTLYDLLMDMLDERGITDNFITELVEYSTTYEQTQYLQFLQQLKSVIKQ